MRLPGISKSRKDSDVSNSQDLSSPSPNTSSKPSKPTNSPGAQQLKEHYPPRTPRLVAEFQPQILNCQNEEWVNQRVLLLHGRAGPANALFESSIIVQHHLDRFPAQTWPVTDSYFKALIELAPGPNIIHLQFLPLQGMPEARLQSSITINYLPVLQNPPLHLAILVAADSPCTYDCPPSKQRQEGNDLNKAVEKLRLAGYLWQAFTGEQMYRHGLGRRTFRIEENWQRDSLSSMEEGPLRQTAKVHIVRTKRTRAELLHPELAQQNANGKSTGDLYNITIDALRDYGGPFDGVCYVAVLLLDSHWDGKLIRGHAALGGSAGDLRLGIFGSHSLHTWPANLEDVVPSFLDSTPTDLQYCANDANESGSHWEAANIGIGAMMHEVGHLMSCPHQPSGVMLRDYVTLNRTFMTKEPYSLRTKSNGPRPCLVEHECHWHRLDAMRFRYHPLFRLPSEQTPASVGASIFPLENGLLVKSPAGVTLVEIHKGGEYRGHIEFPDAPQEELFLFEGDLRERISDTSNEPLKLEIISANQDQQTIDDLVALQQSSTVWSSYSRSPFFKSQKLGLSQMEHSKPSEVIFPPSAALIFIRVHSGSFLDGLTFGFSDGSTVVFGGQGGRVDEVIIDGKNGEELTGFVVRSGFWVDGIAIRTNRKLSRSFGSTGGSVHDLYAPKGYKIVGMHGSSAAWCDGIGIIYGAT